MNIKTVILLASGLELIASVEEVRSSFSGELTHYRLNKPFKIDTAFIPTEGEKGVAMIGAPQMLPLMVSAIESHIEVPASQAVLLSTNARFEAAYVQRTTGLQLARG